MTTPGARKWARCALRRAAVVCIAALLLCAAPSAARSVVHVRGQAEVRAADGTVATTIGLQTALAGRRVVIAAYDDDAVPLVLVMRRDGSLRTLTAFDPPVRVPATTFEPDGPNHTAIGGSSEVIAASASLLLVASDWATGKRAGSGYRIGGFAGRVGRFRRCRGIGESGASAIAASGWAFAHDACDPRVGGLVVRDLGRFGAPLRRFEPPDGYRISTHDERANVDMAGPYLALGSKSHRRAALQVWDWKSGREVYRVKLTDLLDEFSFALQSDGKVVVTRTDPDNHGGTSCELHTPLTWYSPHEPVAHVLPYRPCAHGLAMAHGRIVYRGPGGTGSALWMTDTRARPPLRLSGSPWVTDGIDWLPSFDFDGTRIAYGEPGCVDDRVVRDTVAAIARRGYLRAMTCRARFAGLHPIEERSDGRVAVRIMCPSGCDGGWWIETAGNRRRRLLDGGELRVPAGTTRTLRSDQTALPRRLAGRHPRRVRVRVVIYLSQPDGSYRRFTRIATIRTTRRP